MKLTFRHHCPQCATPLGLPLFKMTVTCSGCGAEVVFAPAFLGNVQSVVLFSVCGVWLGMQMSTWLDRAPVGRIPMLRVLVDLLAAFVYYLLCRVVTGLFQTTHEYQATVPREMPAQGRSDAPSRRP